MIKRILFFTMIAIAPICADENLIKNPGFEDTADTSWSLNNWAKNEVSGGFDSENTGSGSYAYRLTLTKVIGRPELHFQQKFDIKMNRNIRLSFRMRGTGENKASVIIRKVDAPWTAYASRQMKVERAWKEYVFLIALPEVDPNDTGIFFVLGEAATLWVDDVSITPANDDVAASAVSDTIASLNGQWQAVSGQWKQTVAVPGFLENLPGTKDLHHFTYTREFDVPESSDERRTMLRFDAVGDAADVFVNGQFAGGHIGAALPFEIDISGCVKSQSTGNQLEVMIRDDSFFSTPTEGKDWRNRKHWIPRGMGINIRKGIYQNVSLITRPTVHIADAFVRTSVRDRTISVTYEVFNSKRDAIRARIAASVIAADGTEAFSLPAAEIELGGYVRSKTTVTAPFSGVTLWQPDRPSLYTLRSKLSAQTGPILHAHTVRFGFREVWFSGIHFMLNGIRCNLRGESPSYGEKREMFFTRESAEEMIKRYRAINFNTLRFHGLPPPPHVLDLCDEMGVLVIGESAIYASWKLLDPAHPVFMEHCNEHLTRWVRRDRNHPSIIIWSAENEGLNVNHLSPAQLAEYRRIIDANDGSRPVIFDGDGTGFGASPASVKHYISTIDDLKDMGGKASGYGKDIRNDIYWATNHRQTVPLGVGEFLYPYEAGQRDREREVIYMMGLQTRGYRLADWYDIRPYNPSYCGFLRPEGLKPGYEEVYAIIQRSFAPIAIFDREYDALGPFPKAPILTAGRQEQRTLIIYNDAFSDTSVEYGWRITSGGKRYAGEKKTVTIGLGELIIIPITFTPPMGDIDLELMTAKGGIELFRDSRRFTAR